MRDKQADNSRVLLEAMAAQQKAKESAAKPEAAKKE